MLVKDILQSRKTTFSFEFFPPKSEGNWDKLFETIAKDFVPLKPSYVSVTYGAGGTTRENTHKMVARLQRETDLTVVSHLTCVGSTRDEIYKILESYAQSGIENILALRGDPPRGQTGWTPPPDGFAFTSELAAFIKKHFPRMGIGVAGYPEGHPETPNRLREIEFLKQKVDAGADYIVTQLFFDNRDFYDFCERCEIAGIHVPILAGIMPITSFQMMERLADLAGGARFPAPLIKAVARAGEKEYVEHVGIHWATEQVRDLLDHGVKGIHFYTLNSSRATLKIYESLGVRSSDQLIS